MQKIHMIIIGKYKTNHSTIAITHLPQYNQTSSTMIYNRFSVTVSVKMIKVFTQYMRLNRKNKR
jgi:hypothetical protein